MVLDYALGKKCGHFEGCAITPSPDQPAGVSGRFLCLIRARDQATLGLTVCADNTDQSWFTRFKHHATVTCYGRGHYRPLKDQSSRCFMPAYVHVFLERCFSPQHMCRSVCRKYPQAEPVDLNGMHGRLQVADPSYDGKRFKVSTTLSMVLDLFRERRVNSFKDTQNTEAGSTCKRSR